MVVIRADQVKPGDSMLVRRLQPPSRYPSDRDIWVRVTAVEVQAAEEIRTFPRPDLMVVTTRRDVVITTSQGWSTTKHAGEGVAVERRVLCRWDGWYKLSPAVPPRGWWHRAIARASSTTWETMCGLTPSQESERVEDEPSEGLCQECVRHWAEFKPEECGRV